MLESRAITALTIAHNTVDVGIDGGISNLGTVRLNAGSCVSDNTGRICDNVVIRTDWLG